MRHHLTILVRASLIALVLLGASAACGGTDDAPTAEPGTDTQPPRTDAGAGDPARDDSPASSGVDAGLITSMTVAPDVICGADPAVVTVRYVTEGATGVGFIVDQQAVPGAAPLSGSVDLEVPCDGAAHTIVLAATDGAGGQSLGSRVVLTQPGP